MMIHCISLDLKPSNYHMYIVTLKESKVLKKELITTYILVKQMFLLIEIMGL